MSIFDDAKKLADKAEDFVGDHKKQVKDGVDKAADVIDGKTHGKQHDKIDDVADKAKDAIDKLND